MMIKEPPRNLTHLCFITLSSSPKTRTIKTKTIVGYSWLSKMALNWSDTKLHLQFLSFFPCQ